MNIDNTHTHTHTLTLIHIYIYIYICFYNSVCICMCIYIYIYILNVPKYFSLLCSSCDSFMLFLVYLKTQLHIQFMKFTLTGIKDQYVIYIYICVCVCVCVCIYIYCYGEICNHHRNSLNEELYYRSPDRHTQRDTLDITREEQTLSL